MNRLNASIAHIPLPKRMRWTEISDTGYPIPWFVDRGERQARLPGDGSGESSAARSGTICAGCAEDAGPLPGFHDRAHVRDQPGVEPSRRRTSTVPLRRPGLPVPHPAAHAPERPRSAGRPLAIPAASSWSATRAASCSGRRKDLPGAAHRHRTDPENRRSGRACRLRRRPAGDARRTRRLDHVRAATAFRDGGVAKARTRWKRLPIRSSAPTRC